MVTEITSNNTYEVSSLTYTDIKDIFLKVYNEYKILTSFNKIAFVYAIPKFHKTPITFRFITSTVDSISKELSIILNKLLDKLFNKIQLQCSSTWIINNNHKVLEAIEECNNSTGFPGNFMLSTFDFSTLYTTLPHYDLVRCIVALYNKYFNNFISIVHNNKSISFNKEQFVFLLKFCIYNNFIIFNNRIYKQIVGIPMGANYSPNLANLYLHFYENKFLELNPL